MQATQALREKARRVSPVWFVPLVAAAIGLWMAWHSYSTRGSLITISMDTAEGIEAGKTMIKARNVAVGRVEAVRLSEAFDHIIVTARMAPGTQRLLREDTQFWVVKPRIGRGGISGLGTVLSGAFIRLQPGQIDSYADEFVALEQPPATPLDAQGLRVALSSDQADAASAGDPVSFQGYDVGRVESAEFDITTRQLRYRLFIRPPFDRLVTSNTRFWSRSGLSVTLDSEGLSVDVSSLEGLFGGGIAFGVPPGLSQGEPVEENAHFVLYADEEAARQGSFDRHLSYVLLIEDTVRGLSRGAPVEYRGVRVGTVAEVPYQFRSAKLETLIRAAIPVLIHIEPQRLGALGGAADDDTWRARFDDLIEDGLRASLKAGNLLTGALFVDLNFYADAAAVAPGTPLDGLREFPTVSSGLTQLEHKLGRTLDKINALPIEPVLEQLEGRLDEAAGLLERLEATTSRLDQLLASPQTQALPQTLLQSLEEMRMTLGGFQAGGPAYEDLGGTLRRIDRMLQDLQPLLRTLDQRPNALIFNGEPARDPEPRARQP